MSFDEFCASLNAAESAPVLLAPALMALWLDARGKWDLAHEAAQSDAGRNGAWVHAYLHRKEGDRANAGYWYTRAGRPMPATAVSLQTEWEQIVRALLS